MQYLEYNFMWHALSSTSRLVKVLLAIATIIIALPVKEVIDRFSRPDGFENDAAHNVLSNIYDEEKAEDRLRKAKVIVQWVKGKLKIKP